MDEQSKEIVLRFADLEEWEKYHADFATRFLADLQQTCYALEATVKEREAEIEAQDKQFWALSNEVIALKQQLADMTAHYNAALEAEQVRFNQLAAAQLHNEQLRKALDVVGDLNMVGKFSVEITKTIRAALSTQPDLSALEAERQRVAEACGKIGDGYDYGDRNCGDEIRRQWLEHQK